MHLLLQVLNLLAPNFRAHKTANIILSALLSACWVNKAAIDVLGSNFVYVGFGGSLFHSETAYCVCYFTNNSEKASSRCMAKLRRDRTHCKELLGTVVDWIGTVPAQFVLL